MKYERNPPAGAPSKLEKLVILPGESGGVISHTEFELANYAQKKNLKKCTSDRLIQMIKKRDFVIHADSIRELEKIIAASSNSKISEFDLWREIDGKQDVKVHLRSLRRIIEELLHILDIVIFSTFTLNTKK